MDQISDLYSSPATVLTKFNFAGYGAATDTMLGFGLYEVYPTAVPEPSTYIGGMLTVLLTAGSLLRRFWMKKA